MINLLPPQYKRELQGEEWFRLILILGLLLLIFFICLSLSLLSIRAYVSGEIQVQQILVEAQKKEGGELQLERMKEVNSEIAGMLSFYVKRVSFSDIIGRISSALPDEAYLTSFVYTPGAQSAKNKGQTAAKAQIALAGFAPRTEDLLEFRINLEKDPLFGNFHFPPANWIRATNIDFSFGFEI